MVEEEEEEAGMHIPLRPCDMIAGVGFIGTGTAGSAGPLAL